MASEMQGIAWDVGAMNGAPTNMWIFSKGSYFYARTDYY